MVPGAAWLPAGPAEADHVAADCGVGDAGHPVVGDQRVHDAGHGAPAVVVCLDHVTDQVLEGLEPGLARWQWLARGGDRRLQGLQYCPAVDAVAVGQSAIGQAAFGGVAADGGEDRGPGLDPVRAGARPPVRERALLPPEVGEGMLQRGR